MRKHLLTTGLLLTVLALLVLAGRHAAADAPNVNAKPSPDPPVNGDIYNQIESDLPSETVTLTARVELQVSTAPCPDFDGDGVVGISDFLEFVNHFGTSRGDAGYDAKYDLDENDVIGISDFLIFVNSFGKEVTPPDAGVANTIYWTEWETESIRRSDLDGSGIETLVTTGLDAPGGIALDVASGKMYWTDWDTDKIQRSNLDGSGVENLITGLTSPYAIALDVAGGKMYWTDGIADKIQRSNLDGSGVEDLITGLDAPGGIALDVTGGKMYWTDGGDKDKIQRSNLDGSGVEDLITGLDWPLGIALGFGVPVEAGKDLVVRSAVSEDTLTPGQPFALSVTVRNRGTEQAAATTLRYYRSDDGTIDATDTQVGTDGVSSLSAGGTSAESIRLNAPSVAGTYFYGACVDPVTGESNADNNCSSGVSVTVSGGGSGSGGNTGDLGTCRAGLVVKPDESCDYKNGTFFVNSSGTGIIISGGLVMTAGNSHNQRGIINGVRWNFHASKNSGSNSWTIHTAN